jgi:probable phosphoglycerate mutase
MGHAVRILAGRRGCQSSEIDRGEREEWDRIGGVELLLIRHGLPMRVVNQDGTPADPPLSDIGWDQAERVARWLDALEIHRVYASPLVRARETASPLARLLGVEIEIEPGVSEYDADSEFYIPLEELKQTDHPRWREVVSGAHARELGFQAFHDVVVKSLDRIIEANAGKRVAVFCHGGVINCWATHVLRMPPQLFVDARYTSISRFLAASSGERSLASLNETGHLEGLGVPQRGIEFS